MVATTMPWLRRLPHLLVAAAALLPALCRADTEYLVNLNPAQAGCMDSTALGNAVLRLKNRNLCLWLSYTGLSGEELYSHIHGPAKIGVDRTADIIFILSDGSNKNPETGDCFPLKEAQIKELDGGMWYINVHTDDCPDGEIRGQILPV